MSARKYRETAADKAAKGVIRMQPNYHSEINDGYIEAMQAAVNAEKPEGFRLTPITEAGW